MALDEALMARARRIGETVLRVYSWEGPTLSLGRNQRAVGLYDDQVLAERAIGIVRRPTGGRALLHHHEVTYSVTAPVGERASVRTEYDRINALLAWALRALGVDVTIAPRTGPAPAPGLRPCFAEPSAGELTLSGRKLVGSAQWRDAGVLLQHGSILVRDDQSGISALMREPGAAVPAPATLRDALGREPDIDEIAGALGHAVCANVDPRTRPLTLDAETWRDAERLEKQYRDARWTWRR